MTVDQLKNQLNDALNEKDRAKAVKMARKTLLSAVEFIYQKESQKMPKSASLLELIDGPIVGNYVGDAEIIHSMHYVRILGMNAEHGLNVRKNEVKLAVDNIAFFVGLIVAKESGTSGTYVKPPYMSEAATRALYIDTYLREAGWDIVDKKNTIIAGKACTEIEVNGMPIPPSTKGIGYCDYVLYKVLSTIP